MRYYHIIYSICMRCKKEPRSLAAYNHINTKWFGLVFEPCYLFSRPKYVVSASMCVKMARLCRDLAIARPLTLLRWPATAGMSARIFIVSRATLRTLQRGPGPSTRAVNKLSRSSTVPGEGAYYILGTRPFFFLKALTRAFTIENLKILCWTGILAQ